MSLADQIGANQPFSIDPEDQSGYFSTMMKDAQESLLEQSKRKPQVHGDYVRVSRKARFTLRFTLNEPEVIAKLRSWHEHFFQEVTPLMLDSFALPMENINEEAATRHHQWLLDRADEVVAGTHIFSSLLPSYADLRLMQEGILTRPEQHVSCDAIFHLHLSWKHESLPFQPSILARSNIDLLIDDKWHYTQYNQT